jgi:hypothetical protein
VGSGDRDDEATGEDKNGKASLLFAYNANTQQNRRSNAVEDGTEPMPSVQGFRLWETGVQRESDHGGD